MRKFGSGGLALFAVVAGGALLAPAAQAEPVTRTCTATALVRPILGSGPVCRTEPIVCPAGFCLATATVNADQLLGIGITAAKVSYYEPVSGFTGFGGSCTGTARCSASAQRLRAGWHEPTGALCEWTAPPGAAISVLAKVDCTHTLDPDGS